MSVIHALFVDIFMIFSFEVVRRKEYVRIFRKRLKKFVKFGKL